MRSMFSKMFLTAALAAASVLTVTSARAETVNVPFRFSAQGKTFPAGQYRVEQSLGSSMVTIQSLDGSNSFTALVAPGKPSPQDKRVVLWFDAAGDSHTLRSIQYHNEITSRLDKLRGKHGSNAMQVSSGD